MISRKAIQTFVSYFLLFFVVFSCLYTIHFLLSGSNIFSRVQSEIDSRSPLLNLVSELKDSVSRQTEEINQLRLLTKVFKETLKNYEEEIFHLRNKVSKSHFEVKIEKDLKRYDLSPFFEGSPPPHAIVSKMTTEADFETDWFFDASTNLRIGYGSKKRKAWELSYIYSVFKDFNLLSNNKNGLVLGEVGLSVTHFLVSQGIPVTCIEHSDETIKDNNMIKQKLLDWKPSWLSSSMNDEEYLNLINYRTLNVLGEGLREFSHNRQYDMVWSTGFIELFDSVEGGMHLITSSLQLLKPGGVAVHVIELILDNKSNSLDDDIPTLWHYKDVQNLRDSLCRTGYNVKKLEFGLGERYYDVHPDKIPYNSPVHIKLYLKGHVVTSFALVIEVPSGFVDGQPYNCD